MADSKHLNLGSSSGSWCQVLVKVSYAPSRLWNSILPTKTDYWRLRLPSHRPASHSTNPALTTLQQQPSQGYLVVHLLVLTWHTPKPPEQQQHFLSAYVGCVGRCPKCLLARSTAKFQFHWDSQQAPWSGSKAGSREGSSIAPQQLCYRERGPFCSGTG